MVHSNQTNVKNVVNLLENVLEVAKLEMNYNKSLGKRKAH